MDALLISRFDEYTQNILNETFSQVKETWDFEFVIQRFEYWSGFPRVISWLKFFNENHFPFQLSYSSLVITLFEVAQKNELFVAQTKYEQQISFSFLKEIFKYSKGSLTLDTEETDYLLTIALIFGRYPGIVIGSIRQNLILYENLNILNAFFSIKKVIDTENFKRILDNKFDQKIKYNDALNYIKSASYDFKNLKNTFGSNIYTHIDRTETNQIFDWILSDLSEKNKNVAVVIAKAGYGKTTIIKDLYDRLIQNEFPVLAIKSDKYYSCLLYTSPSPRDS